MTVYGFDSRAFTLAQLSIGSALTDEDIGRLVLHREEVAVETATGGAGVDTSEDWCNDLGLEVAIVDAVIFLVEVEGVLVDGQDVVGWTEDDFIALFGIPKRREQLSEVASVLYWKEGAMAAFFGEEIYQAFYISEPELGTSSGVSDTSHAPAQ